MQAGSRLTAWAAPDQALSEVLLGKEASLNGLVHVNAKGLVAARDADASQHRKTEQGRTAASTKAVSRLLG